MDPLQVMMGQEKGNGLGRIAVNGNDLYIN